MFQLYYSEAVSIMALVLAVFALAPQGACADEPLPGGHYTLTGVNVVPIERSVVDGKVNDHQSDTLTHWIRFDVYAEFTLLDATKTRPFLITNPTEKSKCSLTVDKSIRFKGEALPAGTNLMQHQLFDGGRFNVSMPPLNPLVINSIYIRQDFAFAPDTYQLRFQWETKDGLTLSDTVSVRIDLSDTQEDRGE